MNMSATDTLPGSVGGQDELERGIAAAQAGDKAGAHRIFQSLAARNAYMPDVWVWLGGTSSSLDEAEAAFQRAVMLDPSNEEGNLGLRWVALRRQVTGKTTTTSGLSTGLFARPEYATTVLSDSISSGTLGSGSLSTGGLNTGSLRASDADKAMNMKVGKSGSRRMQIPMAAIVLFALSIILYGIVLYFLVFAPK